MTLKTYKNQTLGFLYNIKIPETPAAFDSLDTTLTNQSGSTNAFPECNLVEPYGELKFDLDKADITKEQKQIFLQFLTQNRDVFATSIYELGCSDIIKVKIDTGDAEPISCKPYRVPYALKQRVSDYIEEMLNAGIISPSESPWASPLVVVAKKPNKDGIREIRICS